ncbi:MAG: hypothetical protein Q9202_000599 [Teloschistes flavicans]
MTDFASKNRQVWHNAAKTYDSKPWQKRLINQITEDIQAHAQWLNLSPLAPNDGSTSVRLLDYACGPGTISIALQPFITSSQGIDIAPGMVEEYNSRISLMNPAPDFHAIMGDLCGTEGVSEDLKAKNLFNFDIAAIGLGFHHFEHLQLSIDRLVERLKSGGVLFIVDLLARQGDVAIGEHKVDHGHGDDFAKEAARTVPHKHGFTRDGMEAMFDAAGLQEFDFVVLERPAVMGEGEGAFSKTIFIAKGRKA